VSAATQIIEQLPPRPGWAGLSPHAPYSTTPALLRLAAEVCRERQWPLAVHLSESIEEFDMFESGRGPMFEWLQTQRDMSDCGQGSPVQHAHRQGALGQNTLAVHVNYLAEGDPDLLARTGTHVVHCPRSHQYFGHQSFPLDRLLNARVNVCLGTDSMASVLVEERSPPPKLSLFPELQLFGLHHSGLSAERILQMVTTSSAQALGRAGTLGELTRGAQADLVVLPFASRVEQAYDAVIEHSGPVRGVMIAGRWAIPSHG
jgi:aminodeoxyfutalosine deaminase